MINMVDENYVGPRDGCGFLHRHKCDGTACDGSKDVPNDSNPFEDVDDTRREDEPGDWFVAGFDGECSRGDCPGFMDGDNATVREDGNGSYECQKCVEFDRQSDEVRRENAALDGWRG